MKTPNLLHGGGSRLIPDGLDLAFIHMNILGQNHITQEDNLGGEEMTLL